MLTSDASSDRSAPVEHFRYSWIDRPSQKKISALKPRGRCQTEGRWRWSAFPSIHIFLMDIRGTGWWYHYNKSPKCSPSEKYHHLRFGLPHLHCPCDIRLVRGKVRTPFQAVIAVAHPPHCPLAPFSCMYTPPCP